MLGICYQASMSKKEKPIVLIYAKILQKYDISSETGPTYERKLGGG